MAKTKKSPIAKKHGKRYAANLDGVAKIYKLADAIATIKTKANAKFDETIEISLNLGIDTKSSDQNVRGVVEMPAGLGKDIKVAVFARGDKADEAKKAGAEHVGADDLAEAITKGEIEFDRCIATPDMMAVVGKLGKVLGPRGLMPNPKLGTVTPDVVKAINSAKAGSVEFRAEKSGIVHAGIGKASFDDAKLNDNIKALVAAVNKAKPSSAKGTYLQAASLSSTMGPGLTLDLTDLAA